MITVENLSKEYSGQRAVDNISFGVEEGETLVLLGTSGSGKTTTLRMVNRLVEPSSGRITINGQDALTSPPERLRRSMGYVLQNHGLFPHYTVAENISIVPRLLSWPEAKTRQRVAELMEKLQLPHAQFKDAYPDTLSGGQKQRVGLARALAASPPILLMDEPFGALDPITRSEIRKEFNRLDELKRKTIVLVTHDVQEAFELGNRICLMDKGAIVQIGTPADLLFRPATDFVRQFLRQQRLPLALKSVRLKSIVNTLPDATASGAATLNSHESLWEALDAFSKTTDTVLTVAADGAAPKEVRFSDIQQALQGLRQE